MDKQFVTNLEDTEALYKSARDVQSVKSDPPNGDKSLSRGGKKRT